jgi:hypothetical protein
MDLKGIHPLGLNSGLKRAFLSVAFLVFALQFAAKSQAKPDILSHPFIPFVPPELTELESNKLTEEQIKGYNASRNIILDTVDKRNGELLRKAEWSKAGDPLLNGIESFGVAVTLKSDSIISEKEVQTKLELTLRRNGIKVDNVAGESLLIASVHLLESDGGTSYTTSLQVSGTVFYQHKNQFLKTTTAIWEKGMIGRCGNKLLKKSINDSITEMAESFCNDYLAQNQNAPKQKPSGKNET